MSIDARDKHFDIQKFVCFLFQKCRTILRKVTGPRAAEGMISDFRLAFISRVSTAFLRSGAPSMRKKDDCAPERH